MAIIQFLAKIQHLIINYLRPNKSNELTHLCKKTSEQDAKSQILISINTALIDLRAQIESSKKRIVKQSEDKVLVVEDDKDVLEEIIDKLSPYYKNINAFQSGTEAMKELKQNAHAYSLVFTDMKIVNGLFADPVQGIDIVEACEQDYPFLVVRITTGLPRYAVQQLSGKKSYEIIYKDKNRQSVRWFDDMDDFVDKINKEIRRKDILRNIPGPQNKVWKYLSLKLHDERIHQPEISENRWKAVKERVEAFFEGKFDKRSEAQKISVSFHKGNQAYNKVEVVWLKHVDNLLTHRLIVLGFANRHNWKPFYFKGDSDQSYVNLAGFKAGLQTRDPKAYFNTILGLSANKVKTSELKYLIKRETSRLFPEEEVWLENREQQDILLASLAPDMESLVSSFDPLNTNLKESYQQYTSLVELESIFDEINLLLTKNADKKTIKKIHFELEDYIEEEQQEFNYLPLSIQDQLTAMLQNIKAKNTNL